MILQNSEAMVAIDMPAGPSEVLVIADKHTSPVHIAADLLSQAEHGPDSQVVLVISGDDVDFNAIEEELKKQCQNLPRREFASKALSHSFTVFVRDMVEAVSFSNLYAPEHLIINVKDAEKWESFIENAGSVFLGPWTPESVGDYASGTNHVLPTYGYARMYGVLASEVGVVEEKEEATIPITTMSPPVGNTRFVDDGSGTTWCVALSGVSQSDLQNALDWACGLGMTDCHAIEHGGPCFEPDTLVSHASFAFNTYYHHKANSGIACNFGGTATLTKRNPSYGKCVYVTSTSGSMVSSTPPSKKHFPNFIWWKFFGILLFLYCIWEDNKLLN